MARFPFFIVTAIATVSLAFSTTADAQSRGFYRAQDVAFFEQVALGELDVTPIGVLKDKRCPDVRLCTFADEVVISFLVDDGYYRREVVLELNRPVAVDGGLLLLTDTGAAPKWNGAIRLDSYNLDLRYIPLD